MIENDNLNTVYITLGAVRRSILLLITGLLVLSLFTVTLSSGSLYAQAQRETYPDNIFASTSQGQLHELVLKATQEDGQANAVPGFKVDLTNVASTPANSDLAIFVKLIAASGGTIPGGGSIYFKQ